jgi:uncharacterized protein (DUF2384 family)
MNGPMIYEECESSPLRCWAPAYRVYLKRRQQILEKATGVFGRRGFAEYWLTNPVFGLRYLIPCTQLTNRESYEHLCDFLCRLEYSVYT